MARQHDSERCDFSDAEKCDLIKLINQGRPLPEKYRLSGLSGLSGSSARIGLPVRPTRQTTLSQMSRSGE